MVETTPRKRAANGRFLPEKVTFPRSTWRPGPGPVVLVGANRKTSPFATIDAELVANWLHARYGLTVLLTVEATPTQAWITWPWWGWKRADGQN